MTALVLVLVAFAPGAALVAVAAAPTSRIRLVALAASPAVTLGLIGAAMSWAGALGWHWSAVDVLLFEAGVVALALALRLARTLLPQLRRPSGRHEARAAGSRAAGSRPAGSRAAEIRRATAGRRGLRLDLLGFLRNRWQDLLALGSALTIALVTGWWMVGRLPFPPGWDAMNHAFMARRLMDLSSTLSSEACVTGSTRPETACQFYPLAPQVLWAQVVELTGAHLSTVMVATVAVLAPVIAVLGVFLIVRKLGGPTWTAFAVAAAPALVGPMWPSLVTGRLTVQLGAALSPATALLVFVVLRYRRARALTLIAGIALGGLALTHTYDLVFGAFFGLGLLVSQAVHRRPWSRWPWVAVNLAVGVAFVILPQIRTLQNADAERAIVPPRFPGATGQALVNWVFSPGRYLGTFILDGKAASAGFTRGPVQVLSALVVAGILLGLVASLRRRFRWARPFALTYVLTMGLVIFIDSATGPVRQVVAGLFYGDAYRLFWAGVVAPGVLAITGWVFVLAMVVERSARRPTVTGSRVVAALTRTAVPVGLLLALGGSLAVAPGTAAAPGRLAIRAPTDPAYRRVGPWLAAHIPPGEVIADDLHRDFATWFYADYGVPVLKGLVPLKGHALTDWDNRERLWRTLVGERPPVPGCLPDPYHVAYVVVSQQHMNDGTRDYDLAQLFTSPYLRLAHQDGPIRVFAVHGTCQV